MEEAYLHGLTGEDIPENIQMIKNMAKVYLNGLVEENILVVGRMANK